MSQESDTKSNKIKYNKYFDIRDGDPKDKDKRKQKKHGICRLCEDKKIEVIVPMPNSGTTGLRNHLKNKHKSSAPEIDSGNQNAETKGQKKISSLFLNVTITVITIWY